MVHGSAVVADVPGTVARASEGQVYTRRSPDGRPIQISRTFKGDRRETQKELARLVTEAPDQDVPVNSTMTTGPTPLGCDDATSTLLHYFSRPTPPRLG